MLNYLLDRLISEREVLRSDVIIGPQPILELGIGFDQRLRQRLARSRNLLAVTEPDLVDLARYELWGVFFKGHVSQAAVLQSVVLRRLLSLVE